MKPEVLMGGWLDWLLPTYCCGCSTQRTHPKRPFCYSCLSALETLAWENFCCQTSQKTLEGRIPLQHLLTAYPLKPGSVLQQAIHQLKYHHRPGIGIFLGKLSGMKMGKKGTLKEVDALIPLPLHPAKKRKRGYNQAEKICKGLSLASHIPVWTDIVRRTEFTETQTRKDRGERWENLSGTFCLYRPEKAKGKHLLLVDDVITTGASLEACGQTLLQIPDCQLSLFTIAQTESH